MHNGTTQFVAVIASLLLVGCSSVGEYFRVDSLLTHKPANGSHNCHKDGAKETDCNPRIPPLDLDTYTLPGQDAPAYVLASSCVPRAPAEAGLTQNAVSTLARTTSIARNAFQLAAQPWRPNGPLAGMDTATEVAKAFARIESHLIVANGELSEAASKAALQWLILQDTPQVLELSRIESTAIGRTIRLGTEQWSNTLAALKNDRVKAVQALEAAKGDADKKKAANGVTEIADKIKKAEEMAAQLDRAATALEAANKIVRQVGDVFERKLGYCEGLRNNLQSALLSHSDALCNDHKGAIHANASGTNFSLGLATTLLSGAGAIATGQAAQQAYAAAAAATNATRGLVGEQIYQQQFAVAITSAIDSARRTKANGIEGRRLLPVERYSVAEAVRDAQDYHYRCNFYTGLTELKSAIAERAANEPTRIETRVKELDDRIKALTAEHQDSAATDAQKRLLDTNLFELRSERQRLQLRRSNF